MALPLSVQNTDPTSDVIGPLFHRLNNQLGIILANAELLEAKAADDMGRRRAAQVVASVLDAMATAKEMRQCLERQADAKNQTP
jgi:hypothetical protein